MRFLLVFACFITIQLNCFSQSPLDEINVENVNVKYLEHLVKTEIDSVRQSKGLLPLFNDSILYLAAQNQANYLTDKNSLGHFQPENKDKKSPADRVKFFGGKDFISTGENAILVFVHTPYNAHTSKKGSFSTRTINTYQQAAYDIMIGWVNSPGHYANIITKEYKTTGLALVFDKTTKAIRAIQVFANVKDSYVYDLHPNMFPFVTKKTYDIASKNISKNKIELHKDHAYGIKAADDSKECKECKDFDYENNVKLMLKSDSIFIQTKDKSLYNQIIKDPEDGLALEFFTFNHIYSCDNSIPFTNPCRTNGGCIFNGRVCKPIFKEEITDQLENKTQAQGKDKKTKPKPTKGKDKSKSEWVSVFICKVPDYMKTEKTDVNLLVIKGKKLCNIVPTTGVCGEMWAPLDSNKINYLYNSFNPANDKYKPIFKSFNSKPFRTYFEKNQYTFNDDTLKTILDSIKIEDNEITSIAINAYASVEGNKELNEKLFTKRAKELISVLEKKQDSLISMNIVTEENWKMFFEDIKGTQYDHLKGKDTNEIRKFVNVNSHELEPILAKERYAMMTLMLMPKANDRNSIDVAINDFRKILYSKDKILKEINPIALKKAEKIQMFIYDKYPSSDLKNLVSANVKVPLEPRFAPIIFNKLMFDYLFAENKIKDDSLLRGFKKLMDMKYQDPKLDYNYKACIINNKDNEYFAKYYTSDMATDLAAKSETMKADTSSREELQLLSHFSKVKSVYLRTPDKLKSAEEDIEYINKYYEKRVPDDGTKYSLAKLFILFGRYNYATKILESFINKENINHQALILYTKLKYYNNIGKPMDDVVQLILDDEDRLRNGEWCGMFIGPCNINSNVFENETIRRLYCEKCIKAMTEEIK